MTQGKREVKTNNFGIEEGLVARRREELLAQKSAKLSETEEGECRHPTMFRPKRQKVYPATQIPGSKRFPLKEKEELSEPKESKELSDKASLLHQTLLKAEQHYREHMKNGANARAKKGWLTNWRHGDFGLGQAERFCRELKNGDFDTMIDELDKHFAKPETKYNHSSFAPYMLDKINSLLEANSLPSHRPPSEKHYNASFWQIISEQLRIMPAKGALPIGEVQDRILLNVK